MSRLVTRVVVALIGIALPIGLAIVGRVMVEDHGWRLDGAYWLAVLTLVLIVHPLATRATRLDATVAGVATLGFLAWTDPVLMAVLAVPLVAGALANRRATAARTAGMSAVAAMMNRVSASTAQLISTSRSESVRHDHLATVNHFHDVFSTQTRRVSTTVAVAETAFSPVTILTVVLTAGAMLVTPGADILAFLLLGPVIGACIATLTRQRPPGAPPQFTIGTPANIHTTIERLGSVANPGSDARKAVIAAIVTALLQGVGLALAITVVWSLLDQGSWSRLPLFSLLAVAIAHTLALRWSNVSAQAAGVAVLRQLSRRIIDRILMTPEGSLPEHKDQLSCLATRDAVTTSGLPVHALRPFVSAGLTPTTAMLTMILIEWWLVIPVLLLLPLVALAILVLLRELRHDLQSALEATNRVLAFLAR